MSRTEINFRRNEIKEHNCELVMGYIAQLIDDVLNGSEAVSEMSWGCFLGCIAGLELLGVVDEDEGDALIDLVLDELRE